MKALYEEDCKCLKTREVENEDGQLYYQCVSCGSFFNSDGEYVGDLPNCPPQMSEKEKRFWERVDNEFDQHIDA